MLHICDCTNAYIESTINLIKTYTVPNIHKGLANISIQDSLNECKNILNRQEILKMDVTNDESESINSCANASSKRKWRLVTGKC